MTCLRCLRRALQILAAAAAVIATYSVAASMAVAWMVRTGGL